MPREKPAKNVKPGDEIIVRVPVEKVLLTRDAVIINHETYAPDDIMTVDRQADDPQAVDPGERLPDNPSGQIPAAPPDGP